MNRGLKELKEELEDKKWKITRLQFELAAKDKIIDQIHRRLRNWERAEYLEAFEAMKEIVSLVSESRNVSPVFAAKALSVLDKVNKMCLMGTPEEA